MRGNGGTGRARRGVQVTGLRLEQRVDPMRIAGQGGTAQASAQLAQPGRDPPRVAGPADRHIGLG